MIDYVKGERICLKCNSSFPPKDSDQFYCTPCSPKQEPVNFPNWMINGILILCVLLVFMMIGIVGYVAFQFPKHLGVYHQVSIGEKYLKMQEYENAENSFVTLYQRYPESTVIGGYLYKAYELQGKEALAEPLKDFSNEVARTKAKKQLDVFFSQFFRIE